MTTDWFNAQYDKVFADNPWYGKGILESLEAIPAERWHKSIDHQSIARLVGHMLAWRRLLVEKLRNNDAHVLEYQSPEEWPEVKHLSSKKLLNELKVNQQTLLAELEKISEPELDELVPPRNTTSKKMLLNGVLQHDIYHLGQINLLNAQIEKNK